MSLNASWRIPNIYKTDAQKVADEIGNEKITPEQVVEKAKDETSELHKCFEWNDSIAAEKYRITQARNILRMLVYAPQKEDEQPVRVYHITTEKCTYQPTKHFVLQEDEYQSLLKRAMAELQAFKKKYHTLTELEAIFEAMETI